MSVCFTHPGGSYVHTRRERSDVALGLRVINYVWRHRDLERACVRGIHVYVGCVCARARMIEIKERRSTTWERRIGMTICMHVRMQGRRPDN